MNGNKRDYRIQCVSEGHAQQQFRSTKYRNRCRQKVIFEIRDKGVVKQRLFKGPHQDQTEEEQ